MTAPGRQARPWASAGAATVTGMLAASELIPGDTVAERYRIERVLGMGAMGVVFLARDTQLEIDVALKLLRPELASRPESFDRFRQELLLARQVSSPHVVRIHDLVRHAQAWLISMDYVRGESLERVLAREGVLPVDRALAIARQLAQGLSVAHTRGVIHRDLKPANVMIDDSGDALITDFGVARSVGATGLTASGVIVGTPAYLSPEQAQALPLDGRSDLYALGLMLFEMLTGTLPFTDGTPSEMLVQRIVRNPASVRTINTLIPEWVSRLVSRMLDPRLGGRFQTAAEIVRAIDTRHVPRAPINRRGALTALTIGASIAVAVATGWAWRSTMQVPTSGPSATRLDLAIVPFHGDSVSPESQALLDGISRYLNAQLIAQPQVQISELRRVRNALSRLNFDAEAAVRNRNQIADAVNARTLLEGSLAREKDQWTLRLQAVRPDQAQPLWAEDFRVAEVADLAQRVPHMLASLRRHLGVGAHVEHEAPVDAAGLRALASGGLSSPGTDSAAQAEPIRAMLWWDRLDYLDRSGDYSGAQIEATHARVSLAGAKGRQARRTLALAAVILGEPDSVMTDLQALSGNEADHSVRRLWARALADSGRPDDAALALQHVIDEDSSDVDAWYAMAKYAFLRSDSKMAVEIYLPQAQMLATRLNDKRALADTVNLLGLGYRSLGQSESAAENLERAVGLRREIGNPRGEAASLQNLAMVRATLGQFTEADSALERARELLAPLGDVSAMADLENDIGVFQEERGEYRLALEAYRQALALRQSVGDQRSIGESLLNVGFGYYQVGEFDNAQVHWERAQTLYAKLEDRGGQIRARQSLGLAQTASGDFAGARAALEQSLLAAEAAQLAEERAVSLLSIAELDRLEGHFADAASRALHAHEMFAQRDDQRGQVEATLLGAAVALDIGDWDLASATLGVYAGTGIDNREQRALYEWRRGQHAMGRGDTKAALERAEQAIEDSRAAHSLGTELSARMLKARVLSLNADQVAARRELALARSELSRYASLPLRLELLAASIAVCGKDAPTDYRQARVFLARLPAWGRAVDLHLQAATCLGSHDPAVASAAKQAARAAVDGLVERSSAQQASVLRRRYADLLAAAEPTP